MKKFFTAVVRPLIQKCGIDVVRCHEGFPPGFSERNRAICRTVAPYTMTTPERVNALIDAVDYVAANGIDGAMVECGVWKGGSSMAMMLTLKNLGDESRHVYLYDTFCGMRDPGDADTTSCGKTAHELLASNRFRKVAPCCCPLDEVKRNVFSTGYPKEKICFVEGKVEDTIPGRVPAAIAVLRLDTDWYESTKHELTHLFPLLQPNGVLIIDDYGYWQGARKAVDEYIRDNHIRILLNRIDHTGRIAVKTQ